VELPYDTAIPATGGAPPLSLQHLSGSLPPGLALAGGRLTGTPTAAGDYGFTLKVTDAQGRAATRTMQLTVRPPTPLSVSTSSLPRGVIGEGYSASVAAAGGKPPYTWQITGLPTGLTSSTDGQITGTPTAPGHSTLTVTVTDSVGSQATRQIALMVGWDVPGAELISVNVDGRPGNAASSRAMISNGGRYVYFESEATDLVPGSTTKEHSVYVRDRVTAVTRRIDLPGDTGTWNVLRALSDNGRFALMSSYGESNLWRYDRESNTATELSLQYDSYTTWYSISDDGDLVYYTGGGVKRISDDSFIALKCPNGSGLTHVPYDVSFRGTPPAIYFVTDDCGQRWHSAFRFDLATQTASLVLNGNCTWNSGNICVEHLVPVASDAHHIMTKLTPDGSNVAYTVMRDGVQVPGVKSPRIVICGITEDGQTLHFAAHSGMLPGGSPAGWDIYAYTAGQSGPRRVSPVSDPAGEEISFCSDRGVAAGAGSLAFQYGQQIYLQ
jgi:hypothetical protein